MALLNNLYIHVTDEDVDNSVTLTSHPTESGMPLTDTKRQNPIILGLTGAIVDTETMKAQTIIQKIKALQKAGSLIKYVGQCGTFKNFQIESFNDSYNHKIFGGAGFTMTLKEFRKIKSAYVEQKTTTVESTPKKLAVGDTVIFLGGNVYVSSDATKAASKRGKSTCKITKISNHSWSKHRYHLISTDGRCVYGWVDEANVKANTAKTATSVVAGTQQVNANKTVVYHTVKSGDTLWGLVNITYRSKNLSMTELINNNPTAFINNDPNRLIVGARLRLN